MSRSKVRVRTAVPDDLDLLVRFAEETGELRSARARPTARLTRLASGEAFRSRCRQLLADPQYRVVFAVDDGAQTVLGAAVFGVDRASLLLETPSVHISHLLVAPAQRRRGAGRALVAAAAAYAEERSVEHVVVGVPTTGREANRFFARLGFAPLVVRRMATVAALRRALRRAEPGVEGGAPVARGRSPRRGIVLPRGLARPRAGRAG